MTALPPANRTQPGYELALHTGGELKLQVCDTCKTVSYPPRELCSACLDTCLSWQPVDAGGTLLARVRLARSFEEWFSGRMPWLLVSVRLQSGVSLICHAHESLDTQEPNEPCESSKAVNVHVCLCKDESGSGVLVAMPKSAANERFETLDAALSWPVNRFSGEQAE